jgi:hypothetical protein
VTWSRDVVLLICSTQTPQPMPPNVFKMFEKFEEACLKQRETEGGRECC